MSSALVPIATASSLVHLDTESEGWNLASISDDEGSEIREFVCHIDFETPFGATPLIHAGICGFDIDQRDSARLKIEAVGINASAFDLVIRTWNGTRVYAVDISWIAIGS